MRRAVVVIPRTANVCQECGCNCNTCSTNNSFQTDVSIPDSSLDLHHEIEELKSKLLSSQGRVSQLDQEIVQTKQLGELEICRVQDELLKLRDRYERLKESHAKLQKVNHDLEDKLLKVVTKCESEKMSLQKEVATITSKLVEARVAITELEEENERYRSDCNLAVQMLQCKPSNFVAHKLNALPIDLQDRVKSHMTRDQLISMEDATKQKVVETKVIRVPMPTFPPTAMMYSITHNGSGANSSAGSDGESSTDESKSAESVPTTLIARVLSQPEPKQKPRRLFICSKCKKDITLFDKGIQTCSPQDIDKEMVSVLATTASLKVHKTSRTRQSYNTNMGGVFQI